MRRPRLLILLALLMLSSLAGAPQARGHHGCAFPVGHVSIGFGPAWGWGYGGYGWWGYPWPAYGPAYYPAYPAYSPTVGFADTDISPGKAHVYLDGEYVGTVDDFDGFPSYLSLEPGQHTLEFRLDGYRTMSRTVRIAAGSLIRFDAKLEKGNEPPRADVEVAPESGPEEPEASREAPPEAPGYLKLRVMPPDASVYLDGKFFASGDTLARLHGDIRLEAGSHTLEASRPGYRTARRTFTVAPEQKSSISLEMEPDR